MSFDLYAFDVDELPVTDEAIGELLEDQAGWDSPLSGRLSAFVADLEQRYPGLDDDPDGSPWASWPLTQSMMGGKCCGFNIVWSAADRMLPEFALACQRHGLTLYDPQAGTVTPPRSADDQSGRRKQLWRR
jgi:hypothetical protein